MKKLFTKINWNALKKAFKKDAVKYLLIAGGGMFAIILIFGIWQAGSASVKDKEAQEKSALKTEIPDAEEQVLHGDKRKAYEEEQMLVDVSGGVQNLGELFPVISTQSQTELLPMPLSEQTSAPDKRSENYQHTHRDFQRSIDELNHTAGSSVQNEPPEVNQTAAVVSDEEVIRIRQEEARRQAMEEFDVMMQKYMPQPEQQPVLQEENPNGKNYESKTELTSVSPIVSETGGVSSTLRASARNGFFGSVQVGAQKNTIKASVYGKHVIQNGQFVRFRMDEPMQVGATVLPKGSIIIGKAVIGEDRLFVSIHSIEHQDVIYSVGLDVYDTDGMQGLYLPGSMEMEAAAEIGTDLANALGSSAANSAVFQTQTSAAEQLKTDVGRGLIQGTFRYAGRKLQTVKVTVQDKHKIYLRPKI